MIKTRRFYFIFFLILLTFACYGPALNGDFIWDDFPHLVENPNLNDLKGLKALWTSPEAVYYPLTSTVFWMGRRLWSFNPFPYHVLNVLLHSINAILFWLLLKSFKIPGSRFAALLFALHPVHAESVAWITELKNVLSGFFYLAAALFYFQFEKYRLRKNIRWYAVALLCFALSLLSKTATAMFPLAILVLILWREPEKGRQLETWLWLIPFFSLSAFAAGWTIWEQRFHTGAAGLDWSIGGLERIAIAGKAIWFYLAKLFWPHPLIFVYERWTLNPDQPGFYLGAIGVVLVSLFIFFRRKTLLERTLFAAWAYFVISLFPVLGFFNIYFTRYSFVADHFQYLASLSPIALFATMVWRGSKWLRIRFIISFLCLALLATLTWRRAHVYRNEATMWHVTVNQNPYSWVAHDSLGNVLMQHGKFSEAALHYRKAVLLKPDFAPLHANLGTALVRKGKFDEAARHFWTALSLNPRSAEAHNGLGNVFVQSGNIPEARAHYEQAIRLKPGYVASRENLKLLDLKKRDGN